MRCRADPVIILNHVTGTDASSNLVYFPRKICNIFKHYTMSFIDHFITRTPEVEEKAKVADKPKSKSNIVFQQSGQSNSEVSNMPPVNTAVASYSSGNATQDAMDYFANLLKERNFPGMDYLEFIDATRDENLKEIPSESKRYQVAYVGMKAAGCTKDTLIKTAGQYSDMIDQETVHIQTSFDSAYAEKVTNPRASIEKKNAQMQELSKQIEDLNTEVSKLAADATENENTLTSNKNSFMSAAQATKEKIAKEIDNINNYLK